VGADEPVAAAPGDAVHLGRDRDLALVVTGGEIVEMGDIDIAGVVLAPGGVGQAAVPHRGALEFALVQDGPGDVIEPVQPLPVAASGGGVTEGLERREIGGGRAPLDEPGESQRIRPAARDRCGLSGFTGRAGERNEQYKARRKGTKKRHEHPDQSLPPRTDMLRKV